MDNMAIKMVKPSDDGISNYLWVLTIQKRMIDVCENDDSSFYFFSDMAASENFIILKNNTVQDYPDYYIDNEEFNYCELHDGKGNTIFISVSLATVLEKSIPKNTDRQLPLVG